MNRAVINKLRFPIEGYSYNVQIETSVDGGRNFYYCGNGRYFRTEEEAKAFKEEIEAGQNMPENPEEQHLKDGFYYQFDCMNAFLDGLFNAEEWTEEEAIKTAIDHEATLILYRIEADTVKEKRVVYDPFDCFE